MVQLAFSLSPRALHSSRHVGGVLLEEKERGRNSDLSSTSLLDTLFLHEMLRLKVASDIQGLVWANFCHFLRQTNVMGLVFLFYKNKFKLEKKIASYRSGVT